MTTSLATLAWLVLLASAAAAQTVILDDPLRGSTTGTGGGGVSNTGEICLAGQACSPIRTGVGGAFQPDGWRVTSKNDYILWHIPTLTQGTVEFSVRGIRANDDRPEGADKNELFHMYDWTYQNADTDYSGYRNNLYKHFIRKTNVLDTARVNSLELVWVIAPNYSEPDTAQLSWDPTVTYRFREEWGPDGAGNSVLRTYRDGVLLKTTTVPGTWSPTGHAIRIAASTRAPLYPDFGAPVDAVFSDVKVWSGIGPVGGGGGGGGGGVGGGGGGGGRDNPNGDGSVNDMCGLLGPEFLLLLALRRGRKSRLIPRLTRTG